MRMLDENAKSENSDHLCCYSILDCVDGFLSKRIFTLSSKQLVSLYHTIVSHSTGILFCTSMSMACCRVCVKVFGF